MKLLRYPATTRVLVDQQSHYVHSLLTAWSHRCMYRWIRDNPVEAEKQYKNIRPPIKDMMVRYGEWQKTCYDNAMHAKKQFQKALKTLKE